MRKADLVFLLINALFCSLVFVEQFTGGYQRGLNYYNMGIARGWAFTAAVSMMYFVFTLENKKPRALSLWNFVYSLITIVAVIVIVTRQM